MAMAEVFLPELSGEDFPRAPPPSPEMQPRSHSRVFEIPSSKFDGIGIGLDLRRSTFPFDEEDESPLKDLDPTVPTKVGGERGRGIYGNKHGSPLDSDDDDDNSYPGSPQKRVCCSPLTLPHDFMTTVFPSSTLNSFVSSGFGSFQGTQSFHGSILPENRNGTVTGSEFRNHYGSGGGGAHSQSNSPPYLGSAGHSNQTSPHTVILGECGGGVGSEGLTSSQVSTTTHLTTPTLHPPPPDHNTLSRSYDLHKMHPHLPLSFETTQLPEVRPSRSRTLDSSSPCTHDDEPPRSRSQTLDANYNEDPNQRRRKISIKRKNPDDDDNDTDVDSTHFLPSSPAAAVSSSSRSLSPSSPLSCPSSSDSEDEDTPPRLLRIKGRYGFVFKDFVCMCGRVMLRKFEVIVVS